MLRNSKWLVGLLVVSLMLPMPVLADELSGSVEVGVSSIGVSDDGSKVNEYTKGRSDDGLSATGSVELEAVSETSAVEIDVMGRGSDDLDADVKLDVLGRILRFDASFSSLEHQLDHDRLNYLDAAVKRGGMNKTTHLPVDLSADGVTPNKVPAFYLVDPDGSTGAVYWGSDTGDFSSLGGLGTDEVVVQTGGASLYGEDLTPNAQFSVVREKAETEMEVALPFLPGVTFDIGYHNETREGTEQAIGMSKCSSCHITGEAQTVDEETTDLKAGLTGKFGLLTMRYELTDREYNDKTNDPTMVYDRVMKPGQPFDNAIFQNRMLYDYYDGELSYDQSPDSEKITHALKARVDLAKDTSVVGSYITSETESSKYDSPGLIIAEDKLKASYDGYGIKAVTRLTDTIKLSLFAKASEVEVDDATLTFDPMTTSAGAGMGAVVTPVTDPRNETVGTRDALNAGLDVVLRLAKKSTLRLGYEYDVQDREWDHMETTQHTVKAKYNARYGKDLKVRVGYQFDQIDDPFHNPNAALVPVSSNVLQVKNGIDAYMVGGTGSAALYGTSYYDARVANLSNQPDMINELKFNSTWSPSAKFAATLAVRYAMEENDLNNSTWEQDTLVPTLSAWYAASDKLNLTAAANYFDQRSQTAFCQGFYDG